MTITYQVTIADPFPAGVQQVVNQGNLSGDNFAGIPTDDPAQGGTADPTVLPAAAPSIPEIPAVGGWGLLALVLLLAGLGVRRILA